MTCWSVCIGYLDNAGLHSRTVNMFSELIVDIKSKLLLNGLMFIRNDTLAYKVSVLHSLGYVTSKHIMEVYIARLALPHADCQ